MLIPNGHEHQVLMAKNAGMEAVALRFFSVWGWSTVDGAYAAVVPEFIEMALDGQAATIFGDRKHGISSMSAIVRTLFS